MCALTYLQNQSSFLGKNQVRRYDDMTNVTRLIFRCISVLSVDPVGGPMISTQLYSTMFPLSSNRRQAMSSYLTSCLYIFMFGDYMKYFHCYSFALSLSYEVHILRTFKCVYIIGYCCMTTASKQSVLCIIANINQIIA